MTPIEIMERLGQLTQEELENLFSERYGPDEVAKYAKLISDAAGSIRVFMRTEVLLRQEIEQSKANYRSLEKVYMDQIGKAAKANAATDKVRKRNHLQRKELRRLNRQIERMMTLRYEAYQRAAASLPNPADSGMYTRMLKDGAPVAWGEGP